LLFGGYQWPAFINGYRGAAFNDSWCFAGGHWVQLHPAAAPPELFWTSMTFDPLLQSVVLLGGLPGAGNTTWLFDGSTWGPLQDRTLPPVPRVFETIVWDGTDTLDLLYGGLNGSQLGYSGAQAHGDTWALAENLSVVLTLSPGVLYRGQSLTVLGNVSVFGRNVSTT
ncbi:MAG: hypothetical protein L3K08_07445, partial [Thermoplasmata archaeon]|nr:hypothetical protein [Thermoplasmata archaeon]